MYLNRSIKWLVTLGLSAAVAFSSGAALASSPSRGERSAALAPCLAMLRQELGTVMPSAWPTFLASQCNTLGAATWREADASGRGPYASPQAAPALAIGRGPYASPQTAPALAIGRGPYASLQAAPAPAIGRGPYASPQASSVKYALQSASVPTTGGSGDSISATGGWRDAGASGSDFAARPASTGGWRDTGAGGR